MNVLDKRVGKLEAASPPPRSPMDLDALSLAELERLEAILKKWRPNDADPLPVHLMPDDDLRFLASIPARS